MIVTGNPKLDNSILWY